MHSGLTGYCEYQVSYCSFLILYNECKWWQFTRKSIIRQQLDWLYPLMVSEAKALSRMSDNQ